MQIGPYCFAKERAMKIEISCEEAETLKLLLEERIKRFGPEIHHTDKREYRAMLQQMRGKLEDVLAQLEQRATVCVPAGDDAAI